ncbi:excinuclease ABC subunit A [bacterium]|nr:excinuclease ABC subunit A [bacterium]
MTDSPIVIRGAREHNLQNVSLTLPRNKLIVMTGVSGSGKSSLAFDTLYAEGQRRYVESLSSYARQFLGQMPKPDVDAITGLAPSISIQQKTAGKNPRSTVGTITEIFDYLRVLYARIGEAACYQCGRPITAQSREQIVEQVLRLPDGTRFSVLAPLVQRQKGEFKDLFADLLKQGYLRARVDGDVVQLDSDLKLDKQMRHTIDLVVDRLIAGKTPRARTAEAVEQALNLADGKLIISREVRGNSLEQDPTLDSQPSTLNQDQLFSSAYACTHCGISYEPPSPQLFSFNSPLGMCLDCNGLGMRHDFRLDRILADPTISIAKGAFELLGKWSSLGRWRKHIYDGVTKTIEKELGLPERSILKTPWQNLSAEAQQKFLYGLGDRVITFGYKHRGGVWKHTGKFAGLIPELVEEYRKSKNPMRRKQLEKYMEFTGCTTCHGARFNAQAMSYRVTSADRGALSLPDVCALSIAEAAAFFGDLALSDTEHLIADEILKEIRGRLGFLLRCGLDYLTLDRTAPTLSGGESQRIRLAGQIGCGLVGVVYILDEPSIGLHPRDNTMLLGSLQDLRDQGNTVIVVEHDDETMHAADYIVDFGPGPGVRGGKIVAEGSVENVKAAEESVTGAFLSGRRTIDIIKSRPASGGRESPELKDVESSALRVQSKARRKTPDPQPSILNPQLTISGARHHNLKNVTTNFPLGKFICITGVSGSGKSSLINDILWQVLNRDINKGDGHPGEHDSLTGLELIDKAIDIDQSPIGRTPRSNPATYVKLFDLIRDLYTKLPESKQRGFQPGRFSFNVEGGRCEACEGNGANKLEMDFLADIWVTCPVCQGRRFNKETLEVRFKGKNISEVLNMDVQEALEHFAAIPKIKQLLQTLHDVGLDYIKLGQPSPTLSGGEAQRVKLAKELGKRSTGKTLYILDEPTTGLHFVDIEHLLRVLHGFVDVGNTVIVVEHNLDVIKTADWIIDLGPEGGSGGGEIIATGTPADIAACPHSYTGQALRRAMRLPELATPKKETKKTPKSAARALPDLSGPRWQTASALEKNQSARENVVVKGAAQHNLQHVDIEIPREKMSVFCGPSGSGKSSLAMDTLYAEGQRRYVESLSSYARQFLGQMPKPKVEYIHGLQPAIAIEQKTVGSTPRSTIGTVTEIYDYLRILYARLGTPHCPDCHIAVETQTVDDVIEKLQAYPPESRLLILAPQEVTVGQQYAKLWERLKEQGFRRVRVDGQTHTLDEVPEIDRRRKHNVEIVIDRVTIGTMSRSRLADSIETAFDLGQGVIRAALVDEARPEPEWKVTPFSLFRACQQCGRSFEELSPQNFSFNSPLGWCPSCEGLGTQQGTNLAALISDPTRTLEEGAVAVWPDPASRPLFRQMLHSLSREFDLPLNVPFSQLDAQHQRLVLYGSGDKWISANSGPQVSESTSKKKTATPKSTARKTSKLAMGGSSIQGAHAPRLSGFSFQYKGLYPAIEEASRVSFHYRQQLYELIGEVPCTTCGGSRLRDDAAAVRMQGKTLKQVCDLPLSAALDFLTKLKFTAAQKKVAGDLLTEATSRLSFLVDVGLHYLTLGRPLPTLSGGETQRIRLAGQIGRALTGILYVLDEPTIGLHPSDNGRLLNALQRLRDLGNTIVMVEHDREVLEAADRLYDFGPWAGRFGGTITAQGKPAEILKRDDSLTGKFLSDREQIVIPSERRMSIASGGRKPPEPTSKTKNAPAKSVKRNTSKSTASGEHNQGTDIPRSLPETPGGGWIELLGARSNNLRNVDLRIPLGTLTAVTGVSGSGKSSLIQETLAKAIARKLHRTSDQPGPYDDLLGIEHLSKLIVVDQQPLGSTPASNPATYTGVFEEIRELFARLPDAKVRGYRPARFSFNRPGGRCETCEGNGQKCIEMHFLPDVWVECDDCRGKRYNAETLAVKYRNKSIADVLEMSIGQALELFDNIPKIRGPLSVLAAIGLDYLTLGQSAPTLSGGEAQRVKLAAELARPQSGQTLYLLDEPTTGLHFDDIRKLLKILNSLVDAGNTVVVIEHNLDVIKTADWIIDLGPHAGSEGGWIVAEGTPEEVVALSAKSQVPSAKSKDSQPSTLNSQRMPSLTAKCLAPVLNAGRRGDREAFDASAAMSRRKGDIDVSQLGKNAKMPWEVDGPKWHTQDRVAHNGQRPRWSGEMLRKVIDTLEENDGFAPPNWNARSVVEMVGTKNKSAGWFLHAMTGDEWALTLRFHVPKGRFETESLAEQLQLKEWDALEDIPVNGRQPRVRVNKASGPWQEVNVAVIDEDDIATPAFERFLKEAVDAYFEAANPEKLNLDDLTPWKKLGRKWHVMRKGFLKGKVAWDVETLEALFTLLDDIWPTATVDWSGKVLVNYKQGKQRLATVVTKRPANIELALPVSQGSVSLGRVADIGEDPEISGGSDGQDIVSLKFTTMKQLLNSKLKDFLQSLSK